MLSTARRRSTGYWRQRLKTSKVILIANPSTSFLNFFLPTLDCVFGPTHRNVSGRLHRVYYGIDFPFPDESIGDNIPGCKRRIDGTGAFHQKPSLIRLK